MHHLTVVGVWARHSPHLSRLQKSTRVGRQIEIPLASIQSSLLLLLSSCLEPQGRRGRQTVYGNYAHTPRSSAFAAGQLNRQVKPEGG
jgi:hypothetical protein